jgi:hypothetical protein
MRPFCILHATLTTPGAVDAFAELGTAVRVFTRLLFGARANGTGTLHIAGSCTGSVTANTVAAPGTLVSSILPPMRSTASLQNGAPVPCRHPAHPKECVPGEFLEDTDLILGGDVVAIVDNANRQLAEPRQRNSFHALLAGSEACSITRPAKRPLPS